MYERRRWHSCDWLILWLFNTFRVCWIGNAWAKLRNERPRAIERGSSPWKGLVFLHKTEKIMEFYKRFATANQMKWEMNLCRIRWVCRISYYGDEPSVGPGHNLSCWSEKSLLLALGVLTISRNSKFHLWQLLSCVTFIWSLFGLHYPWNWIESNI